MKLKYSKIKSAAGLDKVRYFDHNSAALTHYLQCKGEDAATGYHQDASLYFDLFEESGINYELPIEYDVPFPPVANPKFRFIDLFAGIGGFRLAFQGVGGKCVFSSEWDKFSQKTYEANFGEIPFGDITKINEKNIPDHDVLLAGFPCQPFSLAGVSKKNALGRQHGFLDKTQGTLFFDIARILKEKKPKAFVLENVKNLRSHDKGNTFRVIEETLEDLGYNIYSKIIDARNYVPQHRERIFIVGFDKKHFKNTPDFQFPEKSESEPIFADILESDPDPKYNLSTKLWSYLKNYAKKHQAAGNGFGFGLTDLNGVARTLSARYHKDGSEILVPRGGSKNPRKMTPLECRRLMGFPEDYKIYGNGVSDTQLYRQFGNSVAVPVVQAVADSVMNVIENQSGLDIGDKSEERRQIFTDLSDQQSHADHIEQEDVLKST